MYNSEFVNGKVNGIMYRYFTNGAITEKIDANHSGAKSNGIDSSYYFSNKLRFLFIIKNYTAIPDKGFSEINETMTKGMNCIWEKDHRNAIEGYTKVIEIDNSYADAYSWRGYCKLYEPNISEAITDLD